MRLPLVLFSSIVIACAPPAEGDDEPGFDAGANTGADAGNNNPADAGSNNGNPDAGGNNNGDCNVQFNLPGYGSASEVLLTGSFTQPPWASTAAGGAIAMTNGGGSWSVTRELPQGSHQYKFIVDGSDWVNDPDNPQSVDDGFGGQNSVINCPESSLCGDTTQFDWRDTVMYFAMVDRFYDGDSSNNSGVPGVTDGDAVFASSGQYEGGDLAGVRAKMSYLSDLGVTSLWLSAPFENRNSAGKGISDNNHYSGYHGYWPSPQNTDYSNMANPQPRPKVESRIGTEAELKGLVTDAHNSGIKVLFDYVMNHIDSESPLFAAHPDWAVYDGGGFKLCGSDCGGQSCWDDSYWGTRCAFTDYLPPLDLYNPAARDWSVNDAIWWAKEFNIDGYRLDAIKHVPLDWLTQLRSRLSTEFPNPAGGRFYLVGETFDYFNRDLLKSFINPTTMLDGQFDFPYKRELCDAVFGPGGNMSNFVGFMDNNDSFYNTSGGAGLMTTWIGNHDIPRAIHFANWHFGNCTEGSHGGNAWTQSFPQPGNAEPYQRLAVAFAVMMTNPGIPLIYYGDEVGLAGGGDPDNRRMMPWNDNDLNQHQKDLRAKVRSLARLRGQFKALGRGVRTTVHSDQDTWVYKRSCGGGGVPDVVVAINRADSQRTVTLPAGAYKDEISGNDVDGGGTYQLGARSFLVLTPRP